MSRHQRSFGALSPDDFVAAYGSEDVALGARAGSQRQEQDLRKLRRAAIPPRCPLLRGLPLLRCLSQRRPLMRSIAAGGALYTNASQRAF